MIPKQFWTTISKRDKDTFIFAIIFAFVMAALLKADAHEIYFILTGAVFIGLYILMRIALLKVQLAEQEAKVKRSPARKAREIVDANATKPEKVALDKFRQSVKTRQK